MHNDRQRRRPWRRLAAIPAALVGVLALSGCSTDVLARGFLPVGVTNQGGRITSLWVGTWIAALGVGVLVWGLIIWCMVVYRRRREDVLLPAQVRYNLPIEILYTVVPLMMIAVLFFYTARDESAIEATSAKPDHTVNVVAKQWAWDFNYVDENVYEATTQVNDVASPERSLPVLMLPVNESVRFDLNSRDVIHSFWVPAFLYKKDVIPGRTNTFEVTPTKQGTFAGRCAELCGEYHSSMLFEVKVVDRATYDQYIQSLKDKGQTGQLGNDLSRTKRSDIGTLTNPGKENG